MNLCSLVMVNDSKEVQDLGPQVKATFAGEVLSEESSSPRSIFACRAASIEAVEDALKRNVLQTTLTSILNFEKELT